MTEDSAAPKDDGSGIERARANGASLDVARVKINGVEQAIAKVAGVTKLTSPPIRISDSFGKVGLLSGAGKPSPGIERLFSQMAGIEATTARLGKLAPKVNPMPSMRIMDPPRYAGMSDSIRAARDIVASRRPATDEFERSMTVAAEAANRAAEVAAERRRLEDERAAQMLEALQSMTKLLAAAQAGSRHVAQVTEATLFVALVAVIPGIVSVVWAITEGGVETLVAGVVGSLLCVAGAALVRRRQTVDPTALVIGQDRES